MNSPPTDKAAKHGNMKQKLSISAARDKAKQTGRKTKQGGKGAKPKDGKTAKQSTHKSNAGIEAAEAEARRQAEDLTRQRARGTVTDHQLEGRLAAAAGAQEQIRQVNALIQLLVIYVLAIYVLAVYLLVICLIAAFAIQLICTYLRLNWLRIQRNPSVSCCILTCDIYLLVVYLFAI
jgi:Flp pilus assembly protein TadB